MTYIRSLISFVAALDNSFLEEKSIYTFCIGMSVSGLGLFEQQHVCKFFIGGHSLAKFLEITR